MKYEISEEDRIKIEKCISDQLEVRDDATAMIEMFHRMNNFITIRKMVE